MPGRQFLPGQHAELWILDVDSGEKRLRWRSDELLFEAPNWTRDGWLLINGDGLLFRLTADGDDEPEQLFTGEAPDLNNDHVLAPDGRHVYCSSSHDFHIYRVPLPGTEGEAQRVTQDDGGTWHFLHGVSPDGRELAWIGLSRLDQDTWRTNIHVSPADGSGEQRQLTDDEFPDDGSEYSPDGQWLWFNSERGSATPGHAQLFRMPVGGGEPEQFTSDERVNWFPHLSPDGRRIVYVSFEPGTLGHPENRPVILRELLGKDQHRDLVEVFGGQGTMNVNSWAPDNRRIAYVAYSRP